MLSQEMVLDKEMEHSISGRVVQDIRTFCKIFKDKKKASTFYLTL